MPRASKPRAERVVRRKLADGTVREYRYPAWQPAAPIERGDTVRALLRAWERSPEWAALAPKTRSQYLIYLRPWLEVADALVAEVTRRDILDARDAIARTRGTGAATAFGRVTAALFAWALDRGWIPYTPAARLKALPGGHLPTWSEAHIATALAGLPEPLRRVAVLGLHTGQRREDLTRMTWAAFDGRAIRLRQGKTGAEMVIPCHPTLRAEIEDWKAARSGVLILTDARGNAWRPEYLSDRMGRALVALGLPDGLNVHGLRKAAARRLAEAGCSPHEIASITGHASLSMVELYTKAVDQERMAGAAIARLQPRNRKQKSE